MARKSRKVKEESRERSTQRPTYRKLGFRSEAAYQRWLRKVRDLPEKDIRHLRAGIDDDDYNQVRLIRKYWLTHKEPPARLLEKKRILVDSADVKNHMSAFAFLDRYQDQILALLRSSDTTDYRRRQLRQMLKELQQAIDAGDIGEPRQLELFRLGK